MKVSEALDHANKKLAESGIPDARREAASLLAFAIARDRTFLIAHPEYELSEEEDQRFVGLVVRRASREPYHYITGTREFYGLDFEVSPDVLIPRPETEILVERSIDLLRVPDAPRFLEIGAGSGCISVSILVNLPSATGFAVDIDEMALEVSRRNANRHHVTSRLTLANSDLFASVGNENFDVVVSNPPYVPAADIPSLQPEVRDHEPLGALTDGGSGLSLIRQIVEGSPLYLKPGGSLIMEFGFGQSAAVKAMFDPVIWECVDVIADIQGIDRVVSAIHR